MDARTALLTIAALAGCARNETPVADSGARGSPASARQHPRVFLKYYPAFDARYCDQEIPNSWVTEAFSHLSEFQQAWDQQGDALLERSVAIVGAGSVRSEETAVLFLCRKTGMATPLILNYWPF